QKGPGRRGGPGGEALASASDAREEIAFNDIFDRIITAWKDQTDRLLATVFDDSDSSIDLLTGLVSDGKMLGGMSDRPANDYNTDYTKNWQDIKYIERAFHALAIPAAWAANRPTPFILDFKHDDKDADRDGCVIDATPYFEERAKKCNPGWRCIDKRSYVLAGVDDTPKTCRQGTSLCVPPKNYFKILKGIEDLQEPGTDKWGHVTVNDLIIGNVMNPVSSLDKIDNSDEAIVTRLRDVASQDIRQAGFQHIPICSPREAKANLMRGRGPTGILPTGHAILDRLTSLPTVRPVLTECQTNHLLAWI
ncbi:chitinase, partial [Colletotrichum plurivorum]